MNMSKEFEYKIEYDVDKETAKITATIPELNHISSFGNTFAEAEANVKEAAVGYLEVIIKEKRNSETVFSNGRHLHQTICPEHR